MAEQKLTNMGNPFAGTGTHVYGDRFVGRNTLVNRLQRDCTSVNLAIRGLPKMGKTSLAYHSVVEQRHRVVTDRPLLTVFFSIGTCRTADEVFSMLTDRVYEGVLDMALPETETLPLKRTYNRVLEHHYDRSRVQAFFEQALCNVAVQVVVIFDEFDKVRTLHFEGHDFSLLRIILSTRNLHGIVVSKRSIYTLENWAKDPQKGPSTFYQLFDHGTIHLQPYNDADIEAYWQRLEPYFAAVELPLTPDYKARALFYAGRHPHLLDIYNNCCYTEWRDRGQLPSDTDIRLLMTNAYKANLEILREEGLLAAAVQVVIGPVYDISEEQFGRLTQYGFLLPVDKEEKMACIGCNTGYVGLDDTGDRTQVWLAPSHYLSLLMKRDFLNRQEFWQEWCATFDAFRMLAERFMKSNWGDDWMHNDDADDVTDLLWDYYDKDEKANITTSPLIDYLTEALLRDLICRHWTTFTAVFAPLSLAQFCERLDYLIKIRNHHAHNNKRFLSEAVREKANEYLKELQSLIDQWAATNADMPLLEVKTAVTSGATLERICNPAATSATAQQDLQFGSCLRGRIDAERKKIYSLPRGLVDRIQFRSLLIDRNNGFLPEYHPDRCDYAADEEVLFELKEMSRNGNPFYFAVNVRPIE